MILVNEGRPKGRSFFCFEDERQRDGRVISVELRLAFLQIKDKRQRLETKRRERIFRWSGTKRF